MICVELYPFKFDGTRSPTPSQSSRHPSPSRYDTLACLTPGQKIEQATIGHCLSHQGTFDGESNVMPRVTTAR